MAVLQHNLPGLSLSLSLDIYIYIYPLSRHGRIVLSWNTFASWALYEVKKRISRDPIRGIYGTIINYYIIRGVGIGYTIFPEAEYVISTCTLMFLSFPRPRKLYLLQKVHTFCPLFCWNSALRPTLLITLIIRHLYFFYNLQLIKLNPFTTK